MSFHSGENRHFPVGVDMRRGAFQSSICGGPGPVALSFHVLSPALPEGVGRTVFCRIGEGYNRNAADAAASDGLFLHDRRAQFPITRKDSGTEIFTDQCRRDQLRAGAEVSIIQREAASPVIVGTQAADQPLSTAKLPAIHAWEVSHYRTSAYSWPAPHHLPVPRWHRRFCRFSLTSSP